MQLKTGLSVSMLLLLFTHCANVQNEAPAPSADTAIVAQQEEANGAAMKSKLTRYEVKPEHQEAFQKVVGAYVAASIAQPGNVMAEAYYEQDKTNVLWLIERWNSDADLDQSTASPAFSAITTLAAKALTTPATFFLVKDLEPLTKQDWRRPAKKQMHH